MTANVQVPAMKTNRTRRLVTTFGFATFGLLAALALSSPANADGVPPLFPVQGVLTGSDGAAVDGPHDIVLRLHGQAEGGTALYQETHADLVVESGSFLAYLGGGTPSAAALTAEVFEDNQDLWLEVAVDGEVITPRFKYGSVPFAAVAGESGNAQQLGGNPPGHYRYASGAGIALSSPGNVLSVADRGITTEKLANGIAVNASTLSTTGAATLASGTVSGTLNVSGATTLAGTTVRTLTTTGETTLASADVTGALDVTGTTTLADTTASDLTITGKATLGSADVTRNLDVNGFTTLASATVLSLAADTLGARTVTATTSSALGTATAASLTTSGNVDVNGVALVGMRQKNCDNATSCTCELTNERLLSGGAIGHLTDTTLAVSRFPYAQRATSNTTYAALCANVAGGNCARITVICARLGS